MTEEFSTGPFNRVLFAVQDGELHTYRYRKHNEEATSTRVNSIGPTTYEGGPRFVEIFVRTSKE